MKFYLQLTLKVMVFIFSGLLANAQGAQSFSYQGLIRAKDGRPVANSIIALRISILKEFDEGDIVFQEEHKIRTDSFGIFSIQVGEGKKVAGDLHSIDWSASLFYLRTEADITGGSDFMEIGVTQFRSVPTALYATNAGGNLWKEDSGQIVPKINNYSVSLLKSNNQEQNVVLVDREQDKYGRILTMTQDGSVLTEISQYDSSGFIGILGASDGTYRASMYNDPETDAGIFGILNKKWDLVTLRSNDGLNGSIYVNQELENGAQGPKMVFTSIPRVKETGIYVFDDKASYYSDEPPVPLAELKVNNNLMAGELLLKGRNGSANIFLGASPLNPDSGSLLVLDSAGSAAIKMDVISDGGQIGVYQKGKKITYSGPGFAKQGLNYTYGPNGNVSTSIGSNSLTPNLGALIVFNEAARTRVIHTVVADAGYSSLYGPKGNSIVTLSSVGGKPNHGLVSVHDEAKNSKAYMYVDPQGNGIVGANLMNADLYKSYIYLKDSNLYVSNTALQGAEAASYIRGTAQLVNGKVEVVLPDYFAKTVSGNKITVMLTPLSADSKGIAVLNKTSGGFVAQELFGGSGNYEFDYEVKGIKKGYENAPVIITLKPSDHTTSLKTPEGVEKTEAQIQSLPDEMGDRQDAEIQKTKAYNKINYSELLHRSKSQTKKQQSIINK